MASTYKTPGVYVEEISLFPPSVAQVETAVPAFIGYTQKAFKNGESLKNKPTRIYSLTEFEELFGTGPDTKYNVYLDGTDAVVKVDSTQKYYLYESLRMFYENGGGKCYIISVDTYDTAGAINASLFTQALTPLAKEDEPTLIVCPDAVLAGADLYTFQQKALEQCYKLQDRFLICDLLQSNEDTAGETLQDRVDEFRNRIGINNLKYGAAYAPFIVSALPKHIRFRILNLFRGNPPGTALELDALSSDNTIKQLIFDLQNAKETVDKLSAIVSTSGILTAPNKTLEEEYRALFDAYATAGTDAAKLSAVKAIYAFTLEMMAAIKGFQAGLPEKVTSTPDPASKASSKSYLLRENIGDIVETSGVKTALETLIKHSNAAKADEEAGKLFTDNPEDTGANLNKALTLTGLSATAADYNAINDPAITAKYANPATDAAKNEEAKNAIAANYSTFISFFYNLQTAAANYEKTMEDSLKAVFGLYSNILNKVALAVSELPPSGAVAGIYAYVDNQRGVWKAPANVSISAVMGPSTLIDNAFQSDLNVDVNAGKSINAIRAFTGKGTLVWGARTLAGNDNEWGYVSVRRFYNMVEESVMKASGQFVFEPNDANTWVKVKGMIENYLTNLWRQGALAGAKAEHAFFVKIGLGETMTAVDILEGRMNVEIGMAVVRPAEFIILKFSHKMQES